jgi:Ca-activated chloride channel family protein
MIADFHFLRPAWLLLLLPLAVLLWLHIRGRYDSAAWRAVVDPRLLPFVLSSGGGGVRAPGRWIAVAVALLAIIALAGPAWEKLPQPVYQKQTALAILLDLSRSMDVADIKPGRLVRARHKITDILKLRTEGQTALVVYAADAFAVTPLTSDTDTIMALLPDLETRLMPAQGSRADRALELAYRLFSNAGVKRGDLLLVSDGIDRRVLERIESLHAENPQHRISVLAVGTPEGGPVPLPEGGFLKATDGSIVVSMLREENLRRLAKVGDGVYATISNDDIDINTLTYLMESAIGDHETSLVEDRSSEQWREFGPWLLLFALPLAALAFRRGAVWLLPLCLVVQPPDAQAFDWETLWRNDDQRASRMFAREEYAAAAEAFDHPEWKASSQYLAGDYQAALENWRRQDGENALYNRGNALARMRRFEDALAAYDELLRENPGHEDALFNKRAIEEFLQRQQQDGQQQQGAQQQQGEQRQQDGQQQQGGQQQGGQQGAGSPANSQRGGDQQGQNGQQGRQDQGERQEQGDASRQTADPAESADGEERQPSASQGSQQDARQAENPAGGEAQDADAQDLASIDEKMSAQAAEQWLRQIPDDPGGLLRRKFLYQYRERGGVAAEEETW